MSDPSASDEARRPDPTRPVAGEWVEPVAQQPGYPPQGAPGYPPPPPGGYPLPAQQPPTYGYPPPAPAPYAPPPGASSLLPVPPPYPTRTTSTPTSALVLLIVSVLSIIATGIIGIPSGILAFLAIRKNTSDPAAASRLSRAGWIVHAINALVGLILIALLVWVVRNR